MLYTSCPCRRQSIPSILHNITTTIFITTWNDFMLDCFVLFLNIYFCDYFNIVIFLLKDTSWWNKLLLVLLFFAHAAAFVLYPKQPSESNGCLYFKSLDKNLHLVWYNLANFSSWRLCLPQRKFCPTVFTLHASDNGVPSFICFFGSSVKIANMMRAGSFFIHKKEPPGSGLICSKVNLDSYWLE